MKIKDEIYPNIKAEEVPNAPAFKPPKKIPKKPSSSIASFTPFISALPKPKRGTEAPAPAKSIKGW